MSTNEKPVFWASSARLNEPERILRQQGWQMGSRPAASDFNWLFNTIQKDLHAAQVQIYELQEKLVISIETLNKDIIDLKTSTAKIKETAEQALRHTHQKRHRHRRGQFEDPRSREDRE